MDDASSIPAKVPVPGAPFPAKPGEVIEFKFRLTPEQRQNLLQTVSLNFATTPPQQPPSPSAPPTPPTQPAPSSGQNPSQGFMGSPEWLFEREQEAYQREMMSYQGQMQQQKEQWEVAHPVRRFTVQATTQCNATDDEIRLRGCIPAPTPIDPRMPGDVEQNTIFAGVYHLLPPQLYEFGPDARLINISAGAEQAIANYHLVIEQDYAPPMLKTEEVVDLVISPPEEPR